MPCAEEGAAYAVEHVRVKALGSDPEVKSWRHRGGAGIALEPERLLVEAGAGVQIRLDGSGLTVESSGELKLDGGHVRLTSGGSMKLEASEAVYLRGGASSVVLDGESDVRTPLLKQEGRTKRPVTVKPLPRVYEPPLMPMADYEAAQRAEQEAAAAAAGIGAVGAGAAGAGLLGVKAGSLLSAGLALVGMIPVIGGVLKGAMTVGLTALGMLPKTGAASVGAVVGMRAGALSAGGSGGGVWSDLAALLIALKQGQPLDIGDVVTLARKIQQHWSWSELLRQLMEEMNRRSAQRVILGCPAPAPEPEVEADNGWGWGSFWKNVQGVWDRGVTGIGNEWNAMIDGFQYTGQSFAEALNGLREDQNRRFNEMFDSVPAFMDYWTYGAATGMWDGANDRASKRNDSVKDWINWISSGGVDTLSGAFAPENPGSADHYLSTFGLFSFGRGGPLKPRGKVGVDSSTGLETRGYQPKPGERTTTREEFQEQDRQKRIEQREKEKGEADKQQPNAGKPDNATPTKPQSGEPPTGDVKGKNDGEGGKSGKSGEGEKRSGSEGTGKDNLTEPSLPKGGKLTDEELEMFNSKKNYPGIEREIDTLKTLRVEGYDVTPLKENLNGGNGFGIKPDSNPDFMIQGKVFDCYAPQGEFSKNKIKEIQGKTKKQATRIILNLDDFNPSDIDILKQEILRKANPNGDLKYLQELLVVKDGKITRWFWKGD